MEMETMSSFDYSKDDDVMLPGFRFHPTDEELVGFYLRRKVEKKPISIELIKQIDLYKYDPWDLSKVSTVGDKEMYFFCIRGRKYRNSIRPNRVTGSGFWKATGIDRPIYPLGHSNECIGLKKSLVYYRGSAGKGTKTDWMMHEFRLPPSGKTTDYPNERSITQEAEVWTLCRIFKRHIASYKKYSPDCRQTPIKQNRTDSISKTCSLESVDNNEQYLSFGDSVVQQNESDPFIDHIDDTSEHFVCQPNSMAEAPLTECQYSSFWSSNEDLFFGDGNVWDELRSMADDLYIQY